MVADPRVPSFACGDMDRHVEDDLGIGINVMFAEIRLGSGFQYRSANMTDQEFFAGNVIEDVLVVLATSTSDLARL